MSVPLRLDVVIGCEYRNSRRERRIRVQREGPVIRLAEVPRLEVDVFRTLFVIPVAQVDELIQALQCAASASPTS